MPVEAPVAPAPAAAAPAKPAAPAAGDVAIPQISTMNTGAQGVRPAPPGTIPAELRPFSERPDSAMGKLRDRLRNKSNPAANKPAPQADKPAGTPAEPAAAAPAKEGDEAPKPAVGDEVDDLVDDLLDDKKPAETPKVDDKKAPDDKKVDEKKEKVNPWKLLEEHKAARANLEKELAETRKLVPNAEQRKQEMAEVEAIKKRNQELEEHMKFVDYQASDEFKTKYQKPYEDQWRASMRDLKGITVTTDDGERDMAPQDLVALVNMPTAQARREANERFGDFANDVMIERDKIKATWDAQQNALEEAKKVGTSKFDQTAKAQHETFEKITNEIREVYTKAVDVAKTNPAFAEFVSEREGDAKHNELLTKGYAFADEAMRLNPMDPNLTPEQRQKIVKKHVAFRHRAAITNVLRYHLINERAAHAETKKRLAAFEGTVPNRGESKPEAGAMAQGGTAMDRMKARLRARAK